LLIKPAFYRLIGGIEQESEGAQEHLTEERPL
jgi:hypothetical protein